ncbi:accessory Sec system S-layer assembly protein [Parageobacillus thermoglucosidasius]|uniref:Accessory Sec system S-layer assembly protein n=1 Tax=Geobacillus sp. (strain Y4.1MC1) TaxID=581103 RepID=A0A7U3YCH2_GEOS0|nr:accessory Sec system S-layer assembly protein [Parageobacillus thermoglucosidasius]MBY6268643.1 accessory Sec system S-layer assembly protein [Parageobacillus thermoglucosidasius]OUM92564.1 MAG: accessory Sec system S-layer assembly protein [Parageobacillus thermoglucosidasius]
MFPFFKKQKQQKDEHDSVVEANELSENSEADSDEEEVKTELSFHPSWNVSIEERYYYQFLHNQQRPLKKNQISLSGIDLKQVPRGYVVTAFVRNSLSRPVAFTPAPLLLLGPNNEVLARKVFDLSELGEVPPRSSRPWKFLFEQETLRTSELPLVDWKLAFELPKQKHHSLDLAESWEKSLAAEDKQKLQALVQSLQPPKPGEVNFMGLQAQQTEQGDLHVTLLIRNGSDKNIHIEQLALQVHDASGDIVASGAFSLDHFEVKANTSKPWTFIFPKSLVTKENPDLRSWKVSLPSSQPS